MGSLLLRLCFDGAADADVGICSGAAPLPYLPPHTRPPQQPTPAVVVASSKVILMECEAAGQAEGRADVAGAPFVRSPLLVLAKHMAPVSKAVAVAVAADAPVSSVPLRSLGGTAVPLPGALPAGTTGLGAKATAAMMALRFCCSRASVSTLAPACIRTQNRQPLFKCAALLGSTSMQGIYDPLGACVHSWPWVAPARPKFHTHLLNPHVTQAGHQRPSQH